MAIILSFVSHDNASVWIITTCRVLCLWRKQGDSAINPKYTIVTFHPLQAYYGSFRPIYLTLLPKWHSNPRSERYPNSIRYYPPQKRISQQRRRAKSAFWICKGERIVFSSPPTSDRRLPVHKDRGLNPCSNCKCQARLLHSIVTSLRWHHCVGFEDDSIFCK